MKQLIVFFFSMAFISSLATAQFVTTPPASKKAAVMEDIGLTTVKIKYNRPGVKGREGQVYGDNGLVPYNEGQPFPWRAGANENTVMYFEDDVTIEGQPLAAGKYGFHIIPAEEEWTLIFSNNHWSWGSFNYDPAEDALRVSVKPKELDESVEWLEYRFVNQTDNSADIEMRWEKKKIQFTVGVDVHALAMASIEQELDDMKGFTWQGWNSAAQYTLSAGKDLDKGLAWAERAVSGGFGAQKNFTTLKTKADILAAMGKEEKASAVMEEALPLANMTEMHFYGRQLIQENEPEKAMKIFKMNREKHPEDNFTTLVGLARGHMATGNYKEASKYFRKAAPNAPQGQQQIYEGLAKQCEEKMEKGG